MIERGRDLVKQALKNRIFRDSSVLLVANWISLGLSIIGSVVLARVLGATGYGYIILTMSIVSTVVSFLDIRTAEGLIHFMGAALAREEPQEAMSFFYVGLAADALLMLITFLVVAIVAPLVAAAYPEGETLRPLVSIYMFSIPFATLESTFQVMTNVFKRFNLLAAGSIGFGLLQLLVLVALAPLGIEAVTWGYVAVAAVSFVMWTAMGLLVLVRNIRAMGGSLRPGDFRGALRRFIPFALHTSISSSIKALTANADTLILGALRPAADVTYYRIARSAASLITVPTSQVSVVIYPELNEAWARDQLERARKLISRYALITLAVSSAALLFYVFTAEWLVRIFYGEEYYEVAGLIANLIMLLGFGVMLESVFRWVRPATLAKGRPQLATFYNTVSILMRLVLLIPLIYLYGLIGAALTYDIVAILTVLVIVFYVMPQLGLGFGLKRRLARLLSPHKELDG